MNTRILQGILAFCVMSYSTTAHSSPAPDANTGIEGVITISPIRPGPIRQDEPVSKPLPNTTVVVENQNGPVKSFTTDNEGKFSVILAAGHYKISKQGEARKIGRFGPFEVDVVAGKMTKVQWDCDTGMR